MAMPLPARQEFAVCATNGTTPAESLFLHRQAQRARAGKPRPLASAAAATSRDIGNIAVIEDSDGIVETLNEFNLRNLTVTFTPVAGATRYKFRTSAASYDTAAANLGRVAAALGDDDVRVFALPFDFPFYGASYTQTFLNSDGNLSFNAGENASSSRSLGRLTGGPPRIAALFTDLDPSRAPGSVRYFADATHAVFSWVSVREYSDFGNGTPQTFQIRLYLDGTIEFAYTDSTPTNAVVGIAPGYAKAGTAVVSFANDTSAEYPAAIAERFGNTSAVDVVALAQKFYQTHEDAYDFLVVYNTMGVVSAPGALAYEATVRSRATGYGVPAQDNGPEYGSPSRLSSVLNMGMIGDYLPDPNSVVSKRASSQDTPMTVLGHEAGHLFLAFASVPDPVDPSAQPMIGYGGSHWSFVFNSEASLNEGEQIIDRGQGSFVTAAVTQGYSPLDRYLMGFAPPDGIETFVVLNPSVSPLGHPQSNVSFTGTRMNITASDVARTMGRRTPDHTVAQRRFRFGFILLVARGGLDADIAGSVKQVDTYREQFVAAYSKFSAGLAIADTTLNRSVRLSLFPAAGVVSGGSTTATISLQKPPNADLIVRLSAPSGVAKVPAQVTIPAGASSATFTVTGAAPGVEELLATPADADYETAYARVQVAAPALLALRTISGDGGGPVVVRLTDANGIAYSGARIVAAATSGSVTPTVAIADSAGDARFQWTPGADTISRLKLSVEAAPSVNVTLNAGNGVPVIGAVVNAASFAAGISPGSIATIFGTNLTGAVITLNGDAVNLFYAGDTQVNFYIPADAPLVDSALAAVSPSGVTATSTLALVSAQPGIFDDAVVHSGTLIRASSTPVKAGDFIEIYCTGLGATRTLRGLQIATVVPTVYFGSVAATPSFAGLAPGFQGLYQVNVRVPEGLPAGSIPLIVTSGSTYSNEVRIAVQ
ncbi:MAG: hypothetical protein ABI806_27440 [Candidatus Solibacter sp.]